MSFVLIFIILLILSLSFLAYFWAKKIGYLRSIGAACCRFVWLCPLMFSFFPKKMTEELPRSIKNQVLHVLIDDSQSMKKYRNFNSPYTQTQEQVDELSRECKEIGCKVKVSKLSLLDKRTDDGYTPLSEVFEQWLFSTRDEPWILFSDGGDFKPSAKWSKGLKFSGKLDSQKIPRGMIVNFDTMKAENIWIADVKIPPFAFEGKPILSHVTLKRNTNDYSNKQVQIQVLYGAKVLASENSSFKDSLEIEIPIFLPNLPKGNNFITYRVLSSATEQVDWDNEMHRNIEVMSDTVGVLHLLGSPSWDGRFIRRYLKSEPKYDLISFYILRDPWDYQDTSERELSLIPFPVNRLFTEELVNFKVIIIQNFTLTQFLMPEYSKNLVNFVKNGGGLLFIGGPRALLNSDLQRSPLLEILPFKLKDELSNTNGVFLDGDDNDSQKNSDSPWYDPDLEFNVTLASTNWQQRSLANVYDEWNLLFRNVDNFPRMKGLHHMENVNFIEDKYTPLLDSVSPDGTTRPLAIASYPGKGRAVWIFSDALWNIAQNPHQGIPRQLYGDFFDSAMTWLMRQNLRKPLLASNLKIIQSTADDISWSALIQGPVIPYFNKAQNWEINVCQESYGPEDLQIEKLGNQLIKIFANFKNKINPGTRCEFKISGQHPAFGSVTSSTSSIFPQMVKDSEISYFSQKLESLAQLTEAKYEVFNKESTYEISKWLRSNNHSYGLNLPKRFRSKYNHYWLLETYWMILILIALPMEVIFRRWHLIFKSN